MSRYHRFAMAWIIASTAAALAPSASAQETPGEPLPPRAKTLPHHFQESGGERGDEYYWLKERDNPEVLAYLRAENAYTEARMQRAGELREKLYQEIVARIPQDDASAPAPWGAYSYYVRFVRGGDYPIHCRQKSVPQAAEEVLVDGNVLAQGHGFFSLRGVQPSPDHKLLAYAVDTVGRRFYSLRFKDLETGETLADEIPGMTANLVWAADSRTVFYVTQDPATLRWNRVFRHRLGGATASDVLVYEEKDETFSVSVTKTKSGRFLLIGSEQTTAYEWRYLDASQPEGEFRIVLPRQRGHEYSVEQWGDDFILRTNDGAKNFRLVAAPVADPRRENWRKLVAHRSDVLIEGIEVFRDFLVVAERKEGLRRIYVRPWGGGEGHYIEFGEPAYLADFDENHEFESRLLRFEYTSMTTPSSIYDYDLASREKTLRKREEVAGGFNPSNYRTERLWAPARDGKRVPVSIVYREGTKRDGSSPLLLYAYGSYGATIDATFDPARLSLLDRGFVYAVAHVRGGQELGREWYEDGKLLHKKNTFFDFIDAAEFLVKEGYTRPERLFATGTSAGGLLMGAVTNLRPDLFKGVVAKVPFVDVMTTMLDASIPLTTAEYDEWGDPRQKESYDYMLSYSPYDNVEAKAYPNLLVTAGLQDSQVQYWEPAKWVARLRARKTDDNLVLLWTNFEAGHGGPSGRFGQHRQTALVYAFLLDRAGIRE